MLPTSQKPDRSACPSGSFGGAGALRFGSPFGRRGIPGVLRATHCASIAPVSITRAVMVASAMRCAFISVLQELRSRDPASNVGRIADVDVDGRANRTFAPETVKTPRAGACGPQE